MLKQKFVFVIGIYFLGDQVCPTDQVNYKLIQGNCYYFEKKKQNFETSQENCKTKFSTDSGKVFEPTSLELYDEIVAAAKSTFGGGWILTGFEKMDIDGNQVKYSDTGIETNIRPWDQNDITGNNKPYLSVNVVNSKWLSRPWGFKAYSVCEKVTLSVSSTTSPTLASKFFSG